MLNQEQIAQGEELLKRSTPGKWETQKHDPNNIFVAKDNSLSKITGAFLSIEGFFNKSDVDLVVWLQNNVADLFAAAKILMLVRQEIVNHRKELRALEIKLTALEELVKE